MVTLAALTLAGCTTTQHTAQRERLESARQRASLEPTRVAIQNAVVIPTSVQLVRDGGRTAFVVTVRNDGRHAVSDLPIVVGYARRGRPATDVNAAAGLPYFNAHLPAIAAGRGLTWVYATGARVPADAQPLVRIGRHPSAPARVTEMSVRIGVRYRHTPGSKRVSVVLDNTTSVPQYQLQVYAYVTRGRRLVAAGDATVSNLSAGATIRVRLDLVGAPSGGIHVEAPPTVVQ